MKVLQHVTDGNGGHYGYAFHCPGCGVDHTITTEPYPNGWAFDGNEQAPTFGPSIHVHPSRILDNDGQPRDMPRCHSWVRAGQIEFLNDSTHALAGKTVPLPEISR